MAKSTTASSAAPAASSVIRRSIDASPLPSWLSRQVCQRRAEVVAAPQSFAVR
jgi:hypothetical protein